MDNFRKSQGIAPSGVGAMQDFDHKSLMMLGLDFWPSEDTNDRNKKAKMIAAYAVYDQRFCDNLSKILKKRINYLMSPSETNDNYRSNSQQSDDFIHLSPMPFIRFPNWYSCPSCNTMRFIDKHEREDAYCDNNKSSCAKLPHYRRPKLVPIRFIIASSEGHITNFPFREWVHKGKTDCVKTMYFKSTTRAGLAGTLIECSCGKKRTMAGSMNLDNENIKKCFINEKMPADMPWLNKMNQDPTEASFRTVQRGSSSAYMPVVKNSVLIPPYTSSIHKYIDDRNNWNNITSLLSIGTNKFINDKYHMHDSTKEAIIALSKGHGFNFDQEEFLFEIIKKYENSENDSSIQEKELTDTEFRYFEYKELLGSRPDEFDRDDFDLELQNMDHFTSNVRKFVNKVVLVTRLVETRALIGFSRLKPATDIKNLLPISNYYKDWLPGMKFPGEGIFIQLNMKQVHSWEQSLKAKDMEKILNGNISKLIKEMRLTFIRDMKDQISIRFIMLHTLAHLLIKQITFDCGYDASSIKERIYCKMKSNDPDMAGILIYTAGTDSEGALGGIVEQGRPEKFINTLKNAIKNSQICSHDPLCMENTTQGINGLNAAACYACTLLPEIACEENNLLLDRRSIIGDFEDPEYGYFSEFINL